MTSPETEFILPRACVVPVYLLPMEVTKMHHRPILALLAALLVGLAGCSKVHATHCVIGLTVDLDTYPATPSPHNPERD